MTKSTWILLALTLALGLASLTAGAADISLAAVLTGDAEALHVLLASRLPRLAAVLCTGVGMSIAGLIMQQLAPINSSPPQRARQFLRRSWESS